jgi:hypothetical protein
MPLCELAEGVPGVAEELLADIARVVWQNEKNE